MNRYYVALLLGVAVLFTAVGVGIAPLFEPNELPELPVSENDPVEEFIKEKKKQLENPDTTDHYSFGYEESEPIIRVRKKPTDPFEAEKETR